MRYVVIDKDKNEAIGTLVFNYDSIEMGDGVELEIDGDFREYRVTRKVFTNDAEDDGAWDHQHVRLYCWDTFTNRKGKVEIPSD